MPDEHQSISTIGRNVTIGHNNIIERDVVIADNVTIGNNNVIMSGSIIGVGTKIEHFVLLKDNSIIGTGCYIDSYCKSSGENSIGNLVTLRFNSTIARAVYIDDNVFISPNVMTIYSDYTGQSSIGTYIKKDSFIGTAAVIGQDITIGESVVIGAQAYVSKDCLIKGIYAGVPAVLIKEL